MRASVSQKMFPSTFAHGGKNDRTSTEDNVSATMFPSLPRADFTVLLTYQKNINISTKNTVTTFYQRSYIVISDYLYNAIKKCRKKNVS